GLDCICRYRSFLLVVSISIMEKICQRQQRRHARRLQLKINQKLKRKLVDNNNKMLCCYCHFVFSMQELTIEHIVPRFLGGTNDESNVALACLPCNKQRGEESWREKRIQIKKENNEKYREQREFSRASSTAFLA